MTVFVPNEQEEAAVIREVEAFDIIGLLTRLVRVPSQIPNEGELSRVLAQELESMRCFDEVRTQPVVGDRANVVALIHGKGAGRTVLLNGHLDIPPVAGHWSRDPYVLETDGGWIYGQGITDMKAGIACEIAAAAAIARSGASLLGDVVVSAVVHHDVSGLGTKYFLGSWDTPIHGAICGEPTDQVLQLAHGGAWQFEVVTRAPEVHISRATGELDAIGKMHRVLNAIDAARLTCRDDLRLEGLPRVVVGTIQGGTSPSRTAGICRASGDVRTVPGMTQESLLRDFRNMLGEIGEDDPNYPTTIRGLVYQRPYQADENWQVVRTLAGAHETVIGSAPKRSRGLPVASYVTDAADLVRAGIETAVYGPTEWSTGGDEKAAAADLSLAARVYALTALRFTRLPA